MFASSVAVGWKSDSAFRHSLLPIMTQLHVGLRYRLSNLSPVIRVVEFRTNAVNAFNISCFAFYTY